MPRAQSLPILTLNTPEQRFTCQSCGRCCRHFTVELTTDDLARIDAQEWDREFGKVPYLEFRGKTWLRQREDGSCVFLQDNGLCRIHAEHGYRAKPLACQLFPFTLNPHPIDRALQTGLSFACPTVIDNTGAALVEHRSDLKTMASNLPDSHTKPKERTVRIAGDREASKPELDIIMKRIDRWLSRPDLSLAERFTGAVALTHSLREAAEEDFSEHDFEMIFDEAEGQTLEQITEFEPDDPSPRELRLLRETVYAHVEDPRIAEVQRRGIRRKALSQLLINRKFSSGKGEIPVRIGEGWPEPIEFERANEPGPAIDLEERVPIEFLLMRYVRARILGGRAFGPGYYQFSIADGLDALWLSLAVAGWLARLHAGGQSQPSVTFADVKAALLVTDRPIGRARWFSSPGEKMRLKYLVDKRGLDRVLFAFRMTDANE